jgi:3-oxoacyl-[acyl-carrier protein] reductase
MMSKPDGLLGKSAVVTGAGRGIGLAVASALAEAGADVWLNSRTEGALDDLCAQLTADYAGTARPIYFDVSDPQGVKAGFTQIQKTSRGLDILVNNAGILRDAMIEMASVEMMDEIFAINLRGVLLCSQYGARLMSRSGGGSIVNIASIIGRVGNAGQAVYGASKAGVIGLTLSLSKELAARQIRVNAIAPGVIDTDMIEALPQAKREALIASIGMGRVGLPADIAPVCAFLASDQASYITGQVIGVDGGLVI